MSSQKQKTYYNAFNLLPNLGPKSLQKIINHFESLEQAWNATVVEFKKAGLNEKTSNSIVFSVKKTNVDQEYEKLIKEEIDVITIEDPQYPKSLQQIHDAPPILYIRGEITSEDDFGIGVVGSRKTSSYGRIVTNDIVKELVLNNVTINSGLALGIDTEAHRAAIQNQGRTLAVLGSGLDWNNIYPQINTKLVREIIDGHGAVISEFPIGTTPQRYNFPRRNRIVSGLSKGILVVEAAEKSGALITANNALDQNREIFAVPGSIYQDNCKGTNRLIQKGAKLVMNANDILEELDLKDIKQYSSARKLVADNLDEKEILSILSKEPVYKDEIIQKIEMDASKVLSTLSLMEMKGYVKDVGGGKFIVA